VSVRRLGRLVVVFLGLLGLAAAGQGLVEERWQLDVFNADLLLDDGTPSGFGNERGRDLIPDGWWADPSDGRVAVLDTEGPDRTRVARVLAAPEVEGRLYTHRVSVEPGQTLVLTTRVRAKPDVEHAGTVALRFVSADRHLGTVKRRVPLTGGQWQDFEVRATAPAGAVAAAVSFNFHTLGQTERTWVEVERLQLDALRVTSREQRPSPERILLVTLGSVRADHVDGYPRDATPTLDRLAAEGTVLLQHSATSSRTPQSLASLWTGTLPGAGEDVDLWSRTRGALASERLASAGFVTGAFLGHSRLGATRGFSRSLHHFWQLDSGETARKVNGHLLPWLAAHRQDDLFAWVHYNEAERPYAPTPPWDARFDGDDLWKADGHQLRVGLGIHEGRPMLPEPVAVPGQFARRYYVARYDGSIAAVDHALKGLLLLLEKLDQVEGTLVVVTADHGVSLTEHDRYFSTGSVYEHDLHVPLILWGPGLVPVGRRVSVRTDHLDLLPTLMDYAGLPAADHAGRSLRGLVEGTVGPSARPWSVSRVGHGEAMRQAIRGPGDWKVITDADFVPLELYDLASDPREERDQLWRRRAVAEELVRGAKAWVEGLPGDVSDP